MKRLIKTAESEMVSIDITAQFQNKKMMSEFIAMLMWMEWCGNVGHCTDFLVRLDGDGQARPKFIFKNEEQQKVYNSNRSRMCELYKNNSHYKDIDLRFDIS